MLRAKIENGQSGTCRNGRTYTMISVKHTAKSMFLCLFYIECIDQWTFLKLFVNYMYILFNKAVLNSIPQTADQLVWPATSKCLNILMKFKVLYFRNNWFLFFHFGPFLRKTHESHFYFSKKKVMTQHNNTDW